MPFSVRFPGLTDNPHAESSVQDVDLNGEEILIHLRQVQAGPESCAETTALHHQCCRESWRYLTKLGARGGRARPIPRGVNTLTYVNYPKP